jgi:hypothetical protein
MGLLISVCDSIKEKWLDLPIKIISHPTKINWCYVMITTFDNNVYFLLSIDNLQDLRYTIVINESNLDYKKYKYIFKCNSYFLCFSRKKTYRKQIQKILKYNKIENQFNYLQNINNFLKMQILQDMQKNKNIDLHINDIEIKIQ